MLPKFANLPPALRVPQVLPYYKHLLSCKRLLFAKRGLDFLGAAGLLAALSPVLAGVALAVLLQDGRPIFFTQQRVGVGGKSFDLYKFRTMSAGSPSISGGDLCTPGDSRITKSGALLRRLRLDELPQLVNILKGEMSFVGTRPELARFVAQYSPAMRATLLLPPGVTSRASLMFKNEGDLLAKAPHKDTYYIQHILPQKMAYNLAYLKQLSLGADIRIVWETIAGILR